MFNWLSNTRERCDVSNLNLFFAQEILTMYRQTHKLSCENDFLATIWPKDRFFTHCPLGGALPLVSSAPPSWVDCSCAAAGERPHPGMKNWDKTGTLRQMHMHKDVTCRRTHSNKSCMRLQLTYFQGCLVCKMSNNGSKLSINVSRSPRWCQMFCFARAQKIFSQKPEIIHI